MEQGKQKHWQKHQGHGLGKQEDKRVEKVVATVLDEKLTQKHAGQLDRRHPLV